jgi:hypothetical protein
MCLPPGIGIAPGLEPNPAEVRVVIETRHGLLVEALVDAGFTVVPVNHLLERGRQPNAAPRKGRQQHVNLPPP